jgi:hypothetical protein
MANDPSAIIDLVAGCRLAVQRVVGIDLDFTQETLPLLDHYMSSATGSREEITHLIAPMCGAYFGEVLRRSIGPAQWLAPSASEPWELRLQFEEVFLELNPAGVALEALMRETSVGWGAHLTVRRRDRVHVESSVALLGDVREDDYYRLSLRYEVVEQVVRTLGRAAQAAGDAEQRFNADDYQRARALTERTLH